jgi:hypothetical protein
METTTQTRKQTIIRMDEAFIEKLKYYSEKKNLSLNAYIESVLKTEIDRIEQLPHLEPCKELSPNILAITGILEGRITQEEIDNDPKLAYILSR